MATYIDAEALIDDLRDLAEANKGTYHEEGFKNAITVVEMQPAVDVVERKDLDTITEAHEQIGYEKGYRDGYAQAKVEVVRCKECRFSMLMKRKDGSRFRVCMNPFFHGLIVEDTDSCSRGR